MVSGFDLFKKHFADYQDCFVLIGGAACDLLFAQQGIEFRTTKDLDVVLFVEVIDERFLYRFWEFIHLGQYQIATKNEGIRTFYRFDKPHQSGYPKMIEIFSRSDAHQLNMPTSISSILQITRTGSNLSVILLNDIYYRFIQEGVVFFEGFPQLNASHLIPLKVKAFLNLTSEKSNGGNVKSTDLEKHFRDVFRLYVLLTPRLRINLPNEVATDMKTFFSFIRNFPKDAMRFQNPLPSEEVLSQMEHIFALTPQ